MSETIAALLAAHKLLVLDGPLATELERRGYDLNDDLWSARLLLEDPDCIRALHLDYFRAGADVAITASYQASLEGFRARGLSETQAGEPFVRSARLAQEARAQYLAEAPADREGPLPLIAGSIGSYGAFLADGSEYRGGFAIGQKALTAFHRPRMAHLADEVDLFALETIPSLTEAKALVDLLREFPEKRAWLCFSARNGETTGEGDDIREVARWVDQQHQIAAVGVNCCSPDFVSSLLNGLRRSTDKPLVVYPNSGEGYDAARGAWNGRGSSFCNRATLDEWYGLGARLIGGCCRTTPEMIRAVADWRRQL